jgi:pyroglutamyl-peptidase
MTILISGFEAFDGSTSNPSACIVQALVTGPDIATVILPVDSIHGPSRLLDAIRQIQPQAILCLGEAAHRSVISVERVAINLKDYRIPDNNGVTLQDVPVISDGPDAYFSNLPVRKITQAILAAGIPVELSLSAGAYLCNQVMYASIHSTRLTTPRPLVGFIHLPSLPQQVVEKKQSYPSMALETSQKAVQIAIQVIHQTLENHSCQDINSA